MRRSLYLFSILLFLGIFAVHFTIYMAFADDSQTQPIPKPVEATTVKSSKSNSSERQIQPPPEPAEATSVKSSEDSGGDDRKRGTASQKPAKCGIIRDDSGDTSRGAKGDETTCGGFCEGLGEICIQDMANGPCYCRPGE